MKTKERLERMEEWKDNFERKLNNAHIKIDKLNRRLWECENPSEVEIGTEVKLRGRAYLVIDVESRIKYNNEFYPIGYEWLYTLYDSERKEKTSEVEELIKSSK